MSCDGHTSVLRSCYPRLPILKILIGVGRVLVAVAAPTTTILLVERSWPAAVHEENLIIKITASDYAAFLIDENTDHV